jgi:glutathione S-transferase
MVLYTCEVGKALGDVPAPFAHPCGRAAKALDRAGYEYEHEHEQVRGGMLKFWTLPKRAEDRAEIKRLSGQSAVPILVLDDGEVVSSSGEIVRWVESHPRS